MKNNIYSIWQKQSLITNNNIVKEKIEIASLTCYVGTVIFSKAKFFSLQLNGDTDVHKNYLKRFAGVEVQVLQTAKDKKELVIILLEPELSDVFVMFIEDLIKSLEIAYSTEDALTIISNRINYWRKLFGKFTAGLLTPEQQRGLFGELLFLKSILLDGVDASKAVNAWLAPEATNQDFYFDGYAVEVKTTKSNTPAIKISNEYQLDTSGLEMIFIAFYQLLEYSSKENSLGKIIFEIRKILKSKTEILNEFNIKIISAGIQVDQEEEYNEMSYSVRNEVYYEVTEEFPKISEHDVDKSISKISYSIDLINCTPFKLSFSEVKKYLIDGKE